MTDYQKKRIANLRKQNFGYAAIAKELKMSTGAVKAFCRRNGLQSRDLDADTEIENISETTPPDGLISCENRGNSSTTNQPGRSERADASEDEPICEVTVSYADEPDETAVNDIMSMLIGANYGR